MFATLDNCNLNNSCANVNTTKPNYVNYWNETQLKDHANVLTLEKDFKSYLGINAFYKLPTGICRLNNSVILFDASGKKPYASIPLREKNDISRFSPNSRLRMLRLVSRINLNSYADVRHATFTFHNDFPTETDELRKLFHLFWVKLNKKFPSCHFVWRFELQKRGAPHYHIMVLSQNKKFHPDNEKLRFWLSGVWLSCTKDVSNHTIAHAVKVTSCTEKQKFFAYISKYQAKIEDLETCNYRVKRWGHSADLHLISEIPYDCSSDFMALLKKKIICYLESRNQCSQRLSQSILDNQRIELFLPSEIIDDIVRACTMACDEILQPALPDFV